MRWLLWWRPPFHLRAVIINRISDPTTALKGVLWQSRGPWLTLRDASLLKAGSQPMPIDGEVVLHRSNVDFVQVIPS